MIVKIPRFVRCNRIAGCRKYGTIELQMTLSAVLNLTAHDIRYLCICALYLYEHPIASYRVVANPLSARGG